MVIYGTSYSPQKAFVDFACRFLEHLANGDVGAALDGLDANEDGSRWSKPSFVAALNAAIGSGKLTSPSGHARSALPFLQTIDDGRSYELSHRLPVDGRWSDAVVVFGFVKRKGETFSVRLLRFDSSD